MNALTVLAVVAGDGQIAQIARIFGVDWPHLAAQIISFAIVCALLYKFAYRRIFTMLEQRREQIAQGIANAEKIKAELDKTESQRQDVMAQARVQAAKLIEETRAAASRVQQEENRKALAEAEQIVARAREAATQDHERMLAELKAEVGRLVVTAATKVTGTILTEADQRRLAETASKEIAAQS